MSKGTKGATKAKASNGNASLDASRLGMVGELFTVRLQRAEVLLNKATSQAWAGYTVRAGSIGVLSLIVEEPGISQIDIARRTNFDKSTITGIVNNLEKLGWAERRPSASDGRSYALHATREGKAKLRGIVDGVKQIEARMLADVPDDMIKQLSELLDLVHASFFISCSH